MAEYICCLMPLYAFLARMPNSEPILAAAVSHFTTRPWEARVGVPVVAISFLKDRASTRLLIFSSQTFLLVVFGPSYV